MLQASNKNCDTLQKELKLKDKVSMELEKEIDTLKQTIDNLQKEIHESVASKFELEKKASMLRDELKLSQDNSQKLSSTLEEIENINIAYKLEIEKYLKKRSLVIPSRVLTLEKQLSNLENEITLQETNKKISDNLMQVEDGGTPGTTSLRDKLSINPEDHLGFEDAIAANNYKFERRNILKKALISLLAPRNDSEIVVREDEPQPTDSEHPESATVLDQADLDLLKEQELKEAMDADLRKQSASIQRDPSLIDLQKAELLIKQEMLVMLHQSNEYEKNEVEYQLNAKDYTTNRKGGAAGGITFGAAAQTGGLFGSTPSASTYGFSFSTTQSKPLFGTTGTARTFGTSSSIFGQPAQNQTTGLFGKSVGFGNTKTAAPIFNFCGAKKFIFGQNNQQKPLFGQPTGGLFGTSASGLTGFGTFGATNKPLTRLFGSKPRTSFGSKNIPTTNSFSFSGNTNNMSGGLFGQKPTATAFGTKTGFGTQTSGFAKGKRRWKGETLDLNMFLEDDQDIAPGYAVVPPRRSAIDWADAMENEDLDDGDRDRRDGGVDRTSGDWRADKKVQFSRELPRNVDFKNHDEVMRQLLKVRKVIVENERKRRRFK